MTQKICILYHTHSLFFVFVSFTSFWKIFIMLIFVTFLYLYMYSHHESYQKRFDCNTTLYVDKPFIRNVNLQHKLNVHKLHKFTQPYLHIFSSPHINKRPMPSISYAIYYMCVFIFDESNRFSDGGGCRSDITLKSMVVYLRKPWGCVIFVCAAVL